MYLAKNCACGEISPTALLFPQNAVENFRAGLGGSIQHSPSVAELGAVFTLLNLEFLERVYRSLNQRSSLMVVRRVDAIEIERGLISPNAADRGPRLIVRAYP